MGFRNPVTTAIDPTARQEAQQAGVPQTSLQTAASGPRVNIYETTDGKGNPLGMVAWEDGISGDTAATAHAGNYSGGGGGLTLSGGTYLSPGITKAAPSLVLQTDQANQSTAQLTAPDGFLVNGRRTDSIGWTYHYLGDSSYNWPIPSAWTIPPGAGPYSVRDLGSAEQLEVEFGGMPLGANLNSGSGLQLQLVVLTAAGSTAVDGGYWSNSTSAAFAVPTRLAGGLAGAQTSVRYQLQARYVGNPPQNMQAQGLATPYLRHRIIPA